MKKYKKEFIELMVRSQVLTFGNFTTKSGRKSPFFINTGNYNTGEQINSLGYYYAQTIVDNQLAQDSTLYGPAYKGIPLSIATSIALKNHFNINTNFTFNRKEKKTHGETGILVGHKLTEKDKVIIVEDVITAGTAIKENLPIIQSFKAHIEAIIVSVDRMERGQGNLSALEEISKKFDIKVYPIVTIKEIVDYLHNRTIDNSILINDEIKEKISLYYKKYGNK